jgi:hypothetical protein
MVQIYKMLVSKESSMYKMRSFRGWDVIEIKGTFVSSFSPTTSHRSGRKFGRWICTPLANVHDIAKRDLRGRQLTKKWEWTGWVGYLACHEWRKQGIEHLDMAH